MVTPSEWKETLATVVSLASVSRAPVPDWVERTRSDWESPALEDSPNSPMKENAHLAPLLEGRFPSSLLVRLPPHEVAQQIQAWHALRLRALWAAGGTVLNLTVLLAEGSAKAADASRLASFTADAPHPLTALVLSQLFEAPPPDTSGRSNTARTLQARQHATILRHWIAIGSFLLGYGDILGWTAVATALTARAVSRLTSSWRFVAQGDSVLVGRVWAEALARAGWIEPAPPVNGRPISPILFPPSTDGNLSTGDSVSLPFLGDIVRTAAATGSSASLGSLRPLANQVYHLLDLLPPNRGQAVAVAPCLPAFKTVLDIWMNKAEKDVFASALDSSLVLEPRILGGAQVRWRPALSTQLAANATVALLFSLPLPHMSAVDPNRIRTLAHALPHPVQSSHARKPSTSAAALLGRSASLAPPAPSNRSSMSSRNVPPIPTSCIVPGALCVQARTGTLSLRRPGAQSPLLAQAFSYVTLYQLDGVPYAAYPPAKGPDGTPNHGLLAIGSELVVRPLSESFLPATSSTSKEVKHASVSGSTISNQDPDPFVAGVQEVIDTSAPQHRPRRLSSSAATAGSSRPVSWASSRSRRSSIPRASVASEASPYLHVELQSATLERLGMFKGPLALLHAVLTPSIPQLT